MLDIGYRVASDERRLINSVNLTLWDRIFCILNLHYSRTLCIIFLKMQTHTCTPLCLYCTFLLEIIAQSITFFTLKAVKWKLPPRNLDLLKMPVSFLLLLRYYWNQMQMKIFCIIVWYYVEWKWVLFIIFDTESTWVMEYVRFNPLQLYIRKMRRLKSCRNFYKTRNKFSLTKITFWFVE